MTTAEKIDPEMTIDGILERYPHKAQKIALRLTQAGLQCVGCGAATWETLNSGMRVHGMQPDEMEKLVDDLNKILSEESNPDEITLTPRAAKKYLSILEAENKQGWGLRFEEKKAGCSGLEYILDYSKEPSDEDETFLSQGIQIHIKKELVGKLIGSEIDYIDGLQGAGFKVSNPNVKRSCGCGSSHSY